MKHLKQLKICKNILIHRGLLNWIGRKSNIKENEIRKDDNSYLKKNKLILINEELASIKLLIIQ